MKVRKIKRLEELREDEFGFAFLTSSSSRSSDKEIKRTCESEEDKGNLLKKDKKNSCERQRESPKTI